MMLAGDRARVLVGVRAGVGDVGLRGAVLELDREVDHLGRTGERRLGVVHHAEQNGIGLVLRLAAEPRRRGVERLGVLRVLLLRLLHERLHHRVRARTADEVEGERGVVGRDREVLDRRRGLQHLHVHRLVGERRRREQRGHRGAESGGGEHARLRQAARAACRARRVVGSTSCHGSSCASSTNSSSSTRVVVIASVCRSCDCSSRSRNLVSSIVMRISS